MHVEPIGALTIDASANRRNAEQADAAFASRTRSGAVTLAYALNTQFSITSGTWPGVIVP